jgi:polysaccharide export outer membrane protein
MGGSGKGTSSGTKGYLVDSQGDIVLPVIGRMHASGKTCTRLAEDIASTLRSEDYIQDASVNVQIMNFKFSVLGEVSSPGTYEIEGQRMTILEALSRAGDLNIDGNRDITLIREINGQREIAQIDLRSKELFTSPYYYIKQNDIIYVSPSDRKINTRSDAAQWYGWGLSGVGLTMAIIALCI